MNDKVKINPDGSVTIPKARCVGPPIIPEKEIKKFQENMKKWVEEDATNGFGKFFDGSAITAESRLKETEPLTLSTIQEAIGKLNKQEGMLPSARVSQCLSFDQ